MLRAFLDREFAAAQRGRNLALVMFGIPDLDGVSDECDSAMTDRALVEFGQLLGRMTRRMNLSARCGWRAEAFLSVLSDADAVAAHGFVNRVREAASNLGRPLPPIRAGIAIYQPHMRSPEELIAAAEQALAAAACQDPAPRPRVSHYSTSGAAPPSSRPLARPV